MRPFFVFLFFLWTFFSQAQDSTEVRSFNYSLAPGEELRFEDRSVRFREVISDSRCPRNVTCIWAGEAKVLVELFEGERSCGEEILILGAAAELPRFLQEFFPGKLISLAGMALTPYPEDPGKIDTKEYRLSLQVRPKENHPE